MENTYYELSDEFITTFNAILEKMHLPTEIKYELLGNSKLKGGIKITKLSDLNKHLIKREIVIEINEDHISKLTDKAGEILITQELAKIHLDLEKGKLTLASPDVVTFASVINKYGASDVIDANQMIKLLQMQEEEAKREAAKANKGKKGRKAVPSNQLPEEFFS